MKTSEQVAERDFWREEVAAVLALENEGIQCPSTFDGGAYLDECVEKWRQEAKKARNQKGRS